MVDGTGMCGGCRVTVGGKAQFACVDGPCFDAHEVDFDVAMRRNKAYVREEAGARATAGLGGAAMPVKRAGKTPMPVREAQARAHDFKEVTRATRVPAAFEAERCLRCQDPVCATAARCRLPIPEFIHAVATGRHDGRRADPGASNPLPAICGRVCPQETQCEAECSMTKRFDPVAIGHLERYVADWERDAAAGRDPGAARSRAREGRRHRRGPVGAERGRRARPAAATPSRSTRRCTRRAACCATASRSSGCPRRSSTGRSDPQGDGRRDRLQRHHRQDAHARRAVRASTATRRCSSGPARGCRSSWASRART